MDTHDPSKLPAPKLPVTVDAMPARLHAVLVPVVHDSTMDVEQDASVTDDEVHG